MSLEDPYILETQVSADLDSLIRLVKSQEEDFLQLEIIIAKALFSRAQLERHYYIHDEITQYKHLLSQQQLKQLQYERLRQELYQSNHTPLPLSDRMGILLKRGANRALQSISNSLNQTRHKNGPMHAKFNQVKQICLQILTDTNAENLQELIANICAFSTHKLQVLTIALQSITTTLENGTIDELDKFKCSSFYTITKPLFEIKSNKERRQISLKNKPPTVEKRVAKEESKSNDQQRFHLYKKAKKVVDTLKDVMQFSKQDFIEEFIEVCSQGKDRTMKLLKARNEVNFKQITAFISKNPRKRCRKMSQPLSKNLDDSQAEKQKRDQQKRDQSQATCYTARKSLLLKFKDNDYRQKMVSSEFYRKLSRVEEYRLRSRFVRKTSSEQIKATDKENRNNIIKAIENIICENQQLEIKVDDGGSDLQKRLPPLNKRAISVDQNYKTEEGQLRNSKVGFASSKQGQRRVKNVRLQKSQVFAGKTKTQLKSVNNLLQKQINNKLINLTDMNKQVWF